jgi:hypothetical protein
MTDARVQEAQQLFWQVETLRSLGVPHKAIASKLDRMAQLHEETAMDLLSRALPSGWIDLFAAVTAWGEAGKEHRARSLLQLARQLANTFDGQKALLNEIESLDSWLGGLRVVPALEDFARPLPRFGAMGVAA